MIGSWIQLSAQGIPVPTATGKAIQKDLAELDRLRLDYAVDSVTLFKMDSAYSRLQLSLDQSEISLGLVRTMNSNKDELLQIERDNVKGLKKQVRKQKFLKWLALTGMAGIAIIAVARE